MFVAHHGMGLYDEWKYVSDQTERISCIQFRSIDTMFSVMTQNIASIRFPILRWASQLALPHYNTAQIRSMGKSR
jgi:hypothetical protein